MPQANSRVQELLARVDRFLQWDLITVTPWGVPSISPVGARLVPGEATIWTSTTVGYAAKLRNIRAYPRVALLRANPEEPALLVRGEARIVSGDGTANLAKLFQLMGGAGGSRRFFATSATDPFWSRLYRAYWQRVLVAVRIVEVATLGATGWEPLPIASWSSAQVTGPHPRRRRSRPGRDLIDVRGRVMLESGTPVALATVTTEGSAPLAWPVTARPDKGGAIRVESDFPLPTGRLPQSSLAARVIDDTFEVARVAGWIGTLEAGQGSRLLLPRATYGFSKPPGVVGDLGAGVAAMLRVATLASTAEVSSPDLARAVTLGGGATLSKLELPEGVWSQLEGLFARRNAAAPWYAGVGVLTPDRLQRVALSRLAAKAELERDWAHGLLARGARRVGAAQLAAGAIAFRPDPSSWRRTAAREEAQVQQLLERLIEQLPRGLARPPANAAEAVEPEPGKPGWRGSEGALLGATIAAGSAVAAAVDRWAERRRR
ncbi:MAG: pyridoxamine 5'-phosphate oxidase family protein [Candidatus Dormiibacterota bacterium]